MVIDRNKHNKYVATGVFVPTITEPSTDQSTNTENNNSTSTSPTTNTIVINSGGGISQYEQEKLSGIEAGAQVNQDAYSNITINADNNTVGTITAQTETDTATFNSTNPIVLSLVDNIITISLDWTNVASKEYVTQQIDNLVGSAPGALDTLYELADALGNDPNFATTVTNLIAETNARVDTIEDTYAKLVDLKISNITDLNSGWDGLLLNAPTDYVTRWPTWSEVTDKPTTFTPSAHTHTVSDITNFPSTWEWSKIANKPSWIGSTKPTYTPSEIGALTQSAADGRYALKGGSNATGTWPISISGNAATATNADTLDGYNSTSFDLVTNLSGVEDYGMYVIGLLQITDYTTSGNHARGRLIFTRNNGVNSVCTIFYNLSTMYNTTGVRFGYLKLGMVRSYIQPCTFTYNGKKWAGFTMDMDANYSQGVQVMRAGLRTCEYSTPFHVKYKTSNTGTIDNSEINNSLVINGSDIVEDGVTTGKFVGDLSGNASTASKWATARTISLTGDVTGSVSMDGSANVSLSSTVSADVFKFRGEVTTAASTPTASELTTATLQGTYRTSYSGAKGKLIVFRDAGSSAAYTQLYHTFAGSLMWRSSRDSTLSGIAWRTILDTSNYTSTLDSRYVNASGDTMTGSLILGNSQLVMGDASGVNGRLFFHTDGRLWLQSSNAGKLVISGLNDTNLTEFNIKVSGTTTAKINGSTIWHAGNDGSGSGLDADLLDGYHISNIETGGWTSLVTYTHDTTNGTRYYCYRIGNLNNSGDVILRIRVTTDINYPSYSEWTLRMAYNSEYVPVVSLVPNTPCRNTLTVYVDTSKYLWIKCDALWSSYMHYKIEHNIGNIFITSNPLRVKTSPSNVSYTFSNFGSTRNGVADSNAYYHYSSVYVGALSGNATSATKLQTARTISATGDATWSVSFNGSANASGTLTLASTGVGAGSVGPSANASPALGSSFTVPYITVDAKGRVTAKANRTITLPNADSFSYTLTQKSNRSTNGNWTISGLTPYKPLFIVHAQRQGYNQSCSCYIDIKSGAAVGSWETRTTSNYGLGRAPSEFRSTNVFLVIPNNSTVVLIVDSVDDEYLYAYQ